MSTPRRSRRPGGDKTRRGRWLDAVATAPLSRGARAWALTLARRSSATAKPVWGRQTGQAAEIGCSDRQVRRYRHELETAGLIDTRRGPVDRDPVTGQIRRTMTNLYVFVVGPLRKKSSSHRPDTHDRSNPISLTGDAEQTSLRRRERIAIVDPWLDPADLSPDDPWTLAAATA